MGKDDARAQRLAEALRENLKRRKAQERAVAGRDPSPDAQGNAPDDQPENSIRSG